MPVTCQTQIRNSFLGIAALICLKKTLSTTNIVATIGRSKQVTLCIWYTTVVNVKYTSYKNCAKTVKSTESTVYSVTSISVMNLQDRDLLFPKKDYHGIDSDETTSVVVCHYYVVSLPPTQSPYYKWSNILKKEEVNGRPLLPVVIQMRNKG